MATTERTIQASGVTEAGSHVSTALQLSGTEQDSLRAKLTSQISHFLSDSLLGEPEVADLFSIEQEEVARLMRNHPTNFTIRQLVTFLLILRERFAQS